MKKYFTIQILCVLVTVSAWMYFMAAASAKVIQPPTTASCVTPALTYVGGGSNSATSGTAISCTHGQTINSGDSVMVIIHVNTDTGTEDVVDNNGAYSFTQADDRYLTSNQVAIFYRVAGGSEPAAYNFTRTEDNRWSIIVFVLRPNSGCSVQSPPFDVGPAAPNSGNSTAPQATAITLGEDHVAVIGISLVDNATITHSAIPAGFTEIADVIDQTMEVCYLLDQSAGSTGSKTWTISASSSWEAELISIKPGN